MLKLHLLEQVLLLVVLWVVLNQELGLLDKVIQHSLKLQNSSRVTRIHQVHRLLKVKHGDVWEGLVSIHQVLHLGLKLWRDASHRALRHELLLVNTWLGLLRGRLCELSEQVLNVLIELLLGLLNLLRCGRQLRWLRKRLRLYEILSRCLHSLMILKVLLRWGSQL